jgi:hypothetical protein
MTSEWAIPTLTQTSNNFDLFETSLRHHLSELRVLDPAYRVPMKSTTKELNPKWVEQTAAGLEGSSGFAAT